MFRFVANGRGVFPAQARLTLALVFLGVAGGHAAAVPAALQESAAGDLTPVPHPDLNAVERLIREQLQAERSKLAAKVSAVEVPDSARADAFGGLGRLYHAYDFTEAAQACYRNALVLKPKDFRWAYLLGRLLESQGDLQQAVEHYRRAAAIEPDDLPTLLHLAQAQLNLNRPDLAEPLFKEAISRDPYPSSASALVGLGKISLSRNDPEEAIEYFETAVSMQPEASSIHYPLAMAYRQTGDLEKAREHLKKRGNKTPEYPDPLMEELRNVRTGKQFFWSQGTVALSEGRFVDAVEAFREMVAADPQEPIAHMDLGTALLQLGDVNGALSKYRESLRLSPGNPRLHYNLGLVYTLQKAYPKALEHYRNAVELDPGFENAHFNAANLLMRLGKMAQAGEHYGRVNELNPSHAFARFMQAMTLVKLGRFQAARTLLETSHKALPEDIDITHALARLLAASPQSTANDGRMALKLLEGVLKSQNEVAFEHFETLAMALAMSGQYNRALQVQQAMMNEVKQGGRADLAALLQENLVLYRSGQPCRTPWRADDPIFSPVPGDLAPLKSAGEGANPSAAPTN
ncbi:MAG: tetratricopeptide repeat protein [Acidobacteria bacterium]|nr:tetratricopeptide repeat protein [Acidobacteriota bacterium]